MAASTNARSARARKFVTRRGVELQFTELGFGGAPLGNLYRPMTEKEARVMLEAVWAAGCRYFDTAPLYGLGLSETRLNGFLRPKPRNSYLISTKVGRLLDVCAPHERTRQGAFFETPSRRERFDYSYDGVMRSLEFSLERLGLDQIDIVYGHDVDVFTHGSKEASNARIKEFMTRRLPRARRIAHGWSDQSDRRGDQRMGGRRNARARRRLRHLLVGGPLYSSRTGRADEFFAVVRGKEDRRCDRRPVQLRHTRDGRQGRCPLQLWTGAGRGEGSRAPNPAGMQEL